MAFEALTGVDLPAGATPAAPGSGVARLFAKPLASKPLPHVLGPSGYEAALQTHLARGNVTCVSSVLGSTGVTGVGASATGTGTGNATSLSDTNNHTRSRRSEWLVTVASTTAVAGLRGNGASLWRGNAAGQGGFLVVFRGAPASGVSTTTSRFFMGLRASASSPTDVEPSSLTSMVGIGYDAADANLQLMTNDASGTATKTSLGIAVPTTDRANVWEIALYCPPNGSAIEYEFRDFSTSWTPTPITGSLTTDLPPSTSFLNWHMYHSVGGTSSVTGIAFMNYYSESGI